MLGSLARLVERQACGVRQKPPYLVSDEARALHRSLTVVDLHADPLMWGRDLLARNEHGHVDVPRLIEGGVALQVFSTVTHAPLGINIRRNPTSRPDMVTALASVSGWPADTKTSRLARALHQARALETAMANSGGTFARVRTKEDLAERVAVREPGTTAGMLSIEGAQAFDGRLESIDTLFAAGVRMVGLTHFVDNEVGGSASGESKGGLTDFGRAALKKMEALGIIVDLAHASPRLIDDVLAEGRTPPVVSHTGACAACPNERNLTDAQLGKIAEKKGLVGVGFWRTATCGDDAGAIARSLIAVAKAAGPLRAALGSDFDGAVTAPFDASGVPLVTQALMKERVPEETIALMMGGNALRFLSERLPPR
jgi:microsomal dipeptidase-like Zn-dependent dipeptidase